jgi:sigma-B regulation protein RsbU (phosphoserine phosphatase)
MSAVLLQNDLFPPRVPLAATATIDIHAVSLPAKTFTGDFWFTHRTADRLWFALGDVAGKGLPAALFMAMIQEEIEQRVTSCARAGCDPATTMQRLHALMRPLLPSNRFATVVIGWLCDDGTLRVVNAGHCPPLVVRNGGAVEEIGSTGPVIGILPRSRWTSTTRRLGAGEWLLLYSDGVTEATSRDGEEFGVAGIERALPCDTSALPAREVASAILAAVDRHAAGGRDDDRTLLVIGRG